MPASYDEYKLLAAINGKPINSEVEEPDVFNDDALFDRSICRG